MRDTKARIAAAVGIAGAMVVSLAETTAHADDREQCANAAEQAQSLRDEGKYRRAREQMLVCAREVCPGPIKSDCGKWLDQVERDAPTVVFGAKDGGKDIIEVKVSIDGVVVTEKLDGKPQLVDAGEHTFKFEHGGVVKEEKVLIQAGQKGRSVTVAFGAATTTPPPALPQEEASIVPALVVGGIGVIALGSFALFGIQGKNEVDDLQKCKPRCAESDVDKARTKLIIADISLGVGIVALAVSAYMIITRPKVSDHVDVKTSRRAHEVDKPTFHFDLGATTGGGAAALGGTF
jgi:hypothetical protein